MATDLAPTAQDITLEQALRLLDGPFATMVKAILERRFALWVGSGISRDRVPDVEAMLERVLEHLRGQADPANGGCPFRQALFRALQRAGIDAAAAAALPLNQPVAAWPTRDAILAALRNQYADILDIRIAGQPADYLVWNAVDVRQTYGTLCEPDCEHLAISVLVMEGVLANIASANWDGLIEAALARLNGTLGGMLQVIVDPAHLRDPPGRARLIKFHGCAIHCVEEPDRYRPFLTASRPQITDWPNNQMLAALRHEVQGIATNAHALMVGLSLQDANLQDLFSKARHSLPWPWPCAPDAPGHVFCEDTLGDYQIGMLRVVYNHAYDDHAAEIEESALFRAYGKPALLALVIQIITRKLEFLLERACYGSALDAAALAEGLRRLRDDLAGHDNGDRLGFINSCLAAWSRGMSIFRRGALPANAGSYEPISPFALQEMANDGNIAASGLPELAAALALLGQGIAKGRWTLAPPPAADLNGGTLSAIAHWGGPPARLYFASNAATAIQLQLSGALSNDNVVVIHSDDAWQMIVGGGPDRRSPRGGYGRTGTRSPRHVSMRRLLAEAASADDLSQRFEEEVLL